MKVIKSLIFLVLLNLISCKSIVKNNLETGKIVRDCSGTYLKVASKGDYLVCNDDLLKDKKEDEMVKFTYTSAETCPEKEDEIRCMLYHENLGRIRIKILK